MSLELAAEALDFSVDRLRLELDKAVCLVGMLDREKRKEQELTEQERSPTSHSCQRLEGDDYRPSRHPVFSNINEAVERLSPINVLSPLPDIDYIPKDDLHSSSVATPSLTLDPDTMSSIATTTPEINSTVDDPAIVSREQSPPPSPIQRASRSGDVGLLSKLTLEVEELREIQRDLTNDNERLVDKCARLQASLSTIEEKIFKWMAQVGVSSMSELGQFVKDTIASNHSLRQEMSELQSRYNFAVESTKHFQESAEAHLKLQSDCRKILTSVTLFNGGKIGMNTRDRARASSAFDDSSLYDTDDCSNNEPLLRNISKLRQTSEFRLPVLQRLKSNLSDGLAAELNLSSEIVDDALIQNLQICADWLSQELSTARDEVDSWVSKYDAVMLLLKTSDVEKQSLIAELNDRKKLFDRMVEKLEFLEESNSQLQGSLKLRDRRFSDKISDVMKTNGELRQSLWKSQENEKELLTEVASLNLRIKRLETEEENLNNILKERTSERDAAIKLNENREYVATIAKESNGSRVKSLCALNETLERNIANLKEDLLSKTSLVDNLTNRINYMETELKNIREFAHSARSAAEDQTLLRERAESELWKFKESSLVLEQQLSSLQEELALSHKHLEEAASRDVEIQEQLDRHKTGLNTQLSKLSAAHIEKSIQANKLLNSLKELRSPEWLVKVFQAGLMIRDWCKHQHARRRFRKLIPTAVASSAVAMKALRKRNFVLKEIIDNEASYVKSMRHLLNAYKRPLYLLGELSGKERAPLQDIFNIIDRRPDGILAVHSACLKELEQCVQSWPVTQIGDVVVNLVSCFKVYAEYILVYPSACTLWKVLQEDRHFKSLHDEIEEKPENVGSSFNSLLIKPMQRIPQLRMLLLELKKLTPNEHVDYPSICTALARMDAVAHFINDVKRQDDDQNEIITSVVGLPLVIKDGVLNNHERWLLRQGYLWKYYDSSSMLGQIGGSLMRGQSERHYVFLFDDLLLWTKVRADGKGYDFRGLLDLNRSKTHECTADSDPNANFKHLFNVKDVTGRLITWGAANDDDRERWMSDIKEPDGREERWLAIMEMTYIPTNRRQSIFIEQRKKTDSPSL